MNTYNQPNLVAALKIGVLLCFCLSLREADLGVHAGEQIQPSFPGEGPVPRRELARDEIRTSRGEPEDSLRRDLLSVFRDEDRIQKLQVILNAPWEKNGLEYLWSMVLLRAEGKREAPTFGQTRSVLNLLAYICARHDGCDVGELLKRNFESLFNYMLNRPILLESVFGQDLFGALQSYGSPAVLTPSFWNLFKTPTGVRVTSRMLGAIADEATLRTIKEFETNCMWQDKRMIAETIARIESRLNAAKKQNETSKP